MAEVTEALADACREGRIPALVGSLDDVRAGVLLSLPLDTDEALTALSTRLRQRLNVRLHPAAGEQVQPRAGGNKAGAAQRAHLARPTLYQRLQQIERILGIDLDSAESRTSLHVALLAQPADLRRGARTG